MISWFGSSSPMSSSGLPAWSLFGILPLPPSLPLTQLWVLSLKINKQKQKTKKKGNKGLYYTEDNSDIKACVIFSRLEVRRRRLQSLFGDFIWQMWISFVFQGWISLCSKPTELQPLGNNSLISLKLVIPTSRETTSTFSLCPEEMYLYHKGGFWSTMTCVLQGKGSRKLCTVTSSFNKYQGATVWSLGLCTLLSLAQALLLWCSTNILGLFHWREAMRSLFDGNSFMMSSWRKSILEAGTDTIRKMDF